MIVKVNITFKDLEHDELERDRGTYLELNERRAREIIAAGFAEEVKVIPVISKDDLEETAEEVESNPEELKVDELKEVLAERGVDIPKDAKKADLVELYKAEPIS